VQKFVVTGGQPLKGEVKIAGAKNAVLKLMAAAALTDDPCVLYNVPRISDVAILRESTRAESAHRFIDYLLRPQVAAAIVETTRTAACNGAAQSFLPTALRSDPVLYPPAEILERGEWFAPQSAAGQRLRDRLWTEIKT